MNTPVNRKETDGIDTAERRVVNLSVFEHKKSTVKIVAGINTVPSSEYCYSFCSFNSIAPFGEKINGNQKNFDFKTKIFDFSYKIFDYLKGA